jgi:phosphinothricin acetyltransferase
MHRRLLERAAYNWAVETTVYLKQDCRGKGLGKKLYLTLEDILKRQNIINLNACIAYTSIEDVHLDNSSIAFHEHLCYSKVAHFTKCGYKFGTWYDMIWMEKMLGEHPDSPDPVIPITEIKV